jgi:phosphoribosylglycinamide formyltransferase-1
MRKIAVFASGSGTNAESIVNYFSDSKIAFVDLILSENPNAFVLKRAERLKIDSHLFKIDQLFDGTVTNLLLRRGIDFIVLAGFLKLIPNSLVSAFRDRIVNIHPALLPKYGGKGMYGMKVHSAVLSAGESESGITIHLVNENYDEGSIVFQATCPVMSCDKPETLAERIHSLEHEHYPIVIERLISKI